MTQCPSTDSLRSLIDDNLESGEIQIVSEHVENCATCQRKLAELTANDQYQHAGKFALQENRCDKRRSELLNRISDRLIEGLFDAHVENSVSDNPDFPAGFQLGQYEVLGEIGRGGMGAVYRARNTTTHQLVAIKVLPANHPQDDSRIARFRREARVISSLSHPNIVRAIDFGRHQNYYYLVMEFLPGTDIQDIIRNSVSVSNADACEIARQSALGLLHIHQQGLVHRDVKPSNIRLTVVDGQAIVKLLDLGLARNVDFAATQLTQTGRIIGTLDYMAPEQFGGSVVDIRADIYSLGVTLFAMLTGKAPFSTDNSNLLAVLKRRAIEPTPPIENLRQDLPDELCQLVNRMLSVDASQRPASPESVANQLKPFCSGSRLNKLLDVCASESGSETLNMDLEQTNRIGVGRPVSNSGLERQTSPTRISEAVRHKTSRRKWIATAIGLLGFAILAGIVVVRQTDGGKIIINSHDPNLKIEIVRNSKEVRSFEVGKLDNDAWFRSGEYEIRIPSQNDDRIVIENQKFTLRRGQKKIVSISVEPPVINDGKPDGQNVVPTRTIFSKVTGKYVTWEFPDGGRYVKNPDGTWSVYFAKGGKRQVAVKQVSDGDSLPVIVDDPYHNLYFRFSRSTVESSRNKGQTWQPFYSGKGKWVWPPGQSN